MLLLKSYISVLFVASVYGGFLEKGPIDGRKPPIVGGKEIDIRDTPYQISLRRNRNHICGGSIISDHVVITANHCVYGLYSSYSLSVVAGSTTISPNVGQEFRVARFISHPKYRNINKDYDVAIFILNGRFTFNEFVQPIALATEIPKYESQVLISGWGYLDQDIHVVPNTLRATEVTLFPQSSCSKAYWYMTTDRMLCAGVVGGGIDACQGDSGGPMMYNNELLGVVSAGNGCADPKFFGLYASVPKLRPWIMETIRNNSIVMA